MIDIIQSWTMGVLGQNNVSIDINVYGGKYTLSKNGGIFWQLGKKVINKIYDN